MIKRPMKAPSDSITDRQLEFLKYPVVGSFKLDGFRCCVYGMALTSSMKPIANQYVQSILARPQYDGLDGELIVGSPHGDSVFNRTSGPLRSYNTIPDFRFYVFDNFLDKEESYIKRWMLKSHLYTPLQRVVVLGQAVLNNPDEVIGYEDSAIKHGYEGVMIRSLDASYKEGRATFNEGYIYKRKPFADAEGVIMGFIEAQRNNNEAVEDAMGLMKRSSHQENKVGKDTLGALIVHSHLWNGDFQIGTGVGLTNELRQYIWDNRPDYWGTNVTFKYQRYGSMDAPRMPILKGMENKPMKGDEE